MWLRAARADGDHLSVGAAANLRIPSRNLPDTTLLAGDMSLAVQHIAEAGDGLPLILYLRNDGIGLDTIETLCALEGVAGVKWACPTPLRLAEAIRRGSPDIVWVGGLAEVWAPPLCAVGARGFTSGLINVWPAHSIAIHAALEAGDYARANQLIGVMAPFEEILRIGAWDAGMDGVAAGVCAGAAPEASAAAPTNPVLAVSSARRDIAPLAGISRVSEARLAL
jgi:dihydrodipicolinate synthase/N-acetylneuraminate lyase